ncbi:peptidylprolyl isomerase, partial [Mycobacterium tuberculosis]
MGHLTPVAAPRLACAFVPTNAQRRATAKRKLERQLERRAKQA